MSEKKLNTGKELADYIQDVDHNTVTNGFQEILENIFDKDNIPPDGMHVSHKVGSAIDFMLQMNKIIKA
ncbi:MAG: hypothetical protein ACOCW7_01175 [Bacteroidota bacterium]